MRNVEFGLLTYDADSEKYNIFTIVMLTNNKPKMSSTRNITDNGVGDNNDINSTQQSTALPSTSRGIRERSQFTAAVLYSAVGRC